MSQTPDTENSIVPARKRSRKVWLAGPLLFGALLLFGMWLFISSRPRWYSPADVIRPGSDYHDKMNPPVAATFSSSKFKPLPPFTVVTNHSNIIIKCQKSTTNLVEEKGFIIHRANHDEEIRIDNTVIRLKRIGYLRLPPPVRSAGGYSFLESSVGKFYDLNMKLLPDSEQPAKGDRIMVTSGGRPSYLFDLDIQNSSWKLLGQDMYDATTQYNVMAVKGLQMERYGKDCMVDVIPIINRITPLELVVDLALGDEVEEIPVQPGTSFIAGAASYSLIYAGDIAYDSYHPTYFADSVWTKFNLPASQSKKIGQKQCILVFVTNYLIAGCAPNRNIEFELLDANGERIKLERQNNSSVVISLVAPCGIDEIKSIRLRKYPKLHRLVFTLPRLPNMPPENRNIKNLFKMRAPLLWFMNASEQEDYISGMAQLKMNTIILSKPLPNTYPRWFTNATVADVMEDYAQITGMQDQLYVDQQKLSIEMGRLPLPLLMKKKALDFWKKVKGP